MENPWLRTPTPTLTAEPLPIPTERDRDVWQPLGHSEPVSTLPVMEIDDESSSVWFVGAHGGAGTSTMARLCRGRDAGTAWPLGPRSTSVVVVARSDMRGLRAAQRVALQWMSGTVQSVDLLGVVFVADSGGREPKQLKDFRRFVSGGFPNSWFVPWVETWRTIESVEEANVPRTVRKVTVQICEITERARS